MRTMQILPVWMRRTSVPCRQCSGVENLSLDSASLVAVDVGV